MQPCDVSWGYAEGWSKLHILPGSEGDMACDVSWGCAEDWSKLHINSESSPSQLRLQRDQRPPLPGSEGDMACDVSKALSRGLEQTPT